MSSLAQVIVIQAGIYSLAFVGYWIHTKITLRRHRRAVLERLKEIANRGNR